MKSFEQFEYDESLISEIVNVDVSQRFKTTSSARSTTTGARSPMGGKGMQAPSIPTRPGRRSDGSKKSGIQATMDRNRARAADYAQSKRGSRQISAVGGAVKGFAKYRPDKEDATTGTGLGTNMRALTGRAKSTLAGGISAYQRKKKQQSGVPIKSDKVTGSGKQTGTTGETGVGSLLGKAVKSIGKRALKIDRDTSKTRGGKTITTTGGQAVDRAAPSKPRSQTPSSVARTRSPQVTGSDQPKRERTPEQEAERAKVNKGLGGTKQGKLAQRKIDKQEQQARRNTQVKSEVQSQADKLSSDQLGNARNTPEGKKTLDDIFSAARRIGKEEESKTQKLNNDVRKTNVPVRSSGSKVTQPSSSTGKVTRSSSTPASQQTINVSATRVNDSELPSSKKNQQVKGSSPNQKLLPSQSSGSRTVKATRVKRRNIKNKKYYDTDESGKKTFNQQRYDADKNSVKTKSGGGRPKSKTLEKGKPARDAKRKQAKDGAINTFSNKQLKGVNTKTMIRGKKGNPVANAPETNKQSETNTQITDKTDSELNKMKNRGERRAKRNDAKFTSGSFDVANTQGKFRKKEERKISKRMSKPKVTKESFSHWREEFIWETDKKYPDKVKEIKPMSGKNTITINPEDETAKYKRGY